MKMAALQELRPALVMAIVLGGAMFCAFRNRKLKVIEGEYVEKFEHAAAYPLSGFSAVDDKPSAAVALQLEGLQAQGIVVQTADSLERFSEVSGEVLSQIKEGQLLRVTFMDGVLFNRNIRKVEVLQKKEDSLLAQTIFEC